jgi:hypothetical protein
VIRDSCGERTKEIWPYFSFDSVAVESLRREEPVEVATCWNGVAVFDADWFLPPSTFPQYAAELYPYIISSYSLDDPGGEPAEIQGGHAVSGVGMLPHRIRHPPAHRAQATANIR